MASLLVFVCLQQMAPISQASFLTHPIVSYAMNKVVGPGDFALELFHMATEVFRWQIVISDMLS
jgi:hypothetical protein